LVDNYQKTTGDKNTKFIQIKEKFGGLRLYHDGGDERLCKAIMLLEHLSYTTCEECSAPGRVRTNNYWIRTLCEECHFERQRKINEEV